MKEKHIKESVPRLFLFIANNLISNEFYTLFLSINCVEISILTGGVPFSVSNVMSLCTAIFPIYCFGT